MTKHLNTIKRPEVNNNLNYSIMVEAKNSSLKRTIPNEITIYINNISGKANLKCKLDLKEIQKKVLNAKYNPKKNNFLKMKLNDQKTYAQFYQNGKITCTGVKSEEKLKKAIIEYDNIIKSCGFDTKLNVEKIVVTNISASFDIGSTLPLRKLYSHLAELKETEVKVYYNSELYPAITYKKKVDNSNMTLLIYASGKIIITGVRKKEHINNLFNHVYPELVKFKNS